MRRTTKCVVSFVFPLLCLAFASCAGMRAKEPSDAERVTTPAVKVESVEDGIRTYLDSAAPRMHYAAAAEAPKADLAAAAQNPIASTISVPFENNFQFGADGGLQYVLNLQPVIPHSISENWNLVHRPILPVVYQSATIFGAPRPPGSGSKNWGIGDTLYAAYFSPKKPGAWIWGVAPAVQLPTATSEEFGSQEWGLGASAVALQIKKPWLYGVLVTNVWSLESSASAFMLQPILVYNLDAGWFFETAPQFSAAWEAPSNQRWVIPLGGGVGKITKIGKQPIALRMHFYWNVERPDNAPEALLRFTITLLFPK